MASSSSFHNIFIFTVVFQCYCLADVIPRSKELAFNRNRRDLREFESICGISHNTRIVGGAEADPRSWLWMAALILKQGKNFCGGALITRKHVLTAAHCLVGQNPRNVLVRLGGYDFSDDVDPVAKDYEVTNFKIHPGYDKLTHRDDIALVTLKQDAQFTDLVRPICLPPERRTFFGQIATVVGWGSKEYGGAGSNKLREVSMPVWNNTDCSSAYSLELNESVLCAGYREGGKDTCQGDSGGPLMIQGSNRRWMIAGIVSWGYRCGEPNFPGVYTRVNSYLDWIGKNVRVRGSTSKPIVATDSEAESDMSPEQIKKYLADKLASLEAFDRKSYNGKLAIKRISERLRVVYNSREPSPAEVKLVGQQVEDSITPPKWFLSQTQFCFQWNADGDSGQCWGKSSRLCAQPNSFTPYYNDKTDGRGNGCIMRWAVLSPNSPAWFKKVKICHQWFGEGDPGQCNGGRNPYRCAKVGSFTDIYRDTTQGQGGCLLSWSLSVPEDAPLWATNLRLCFNYFPDGEDSQCGLDTRRQYCAYTGKWTDFYRDNTNSRPGGCQMSWGIFTTDKKVT